MFRSVLVFSRCALRVTPLLSSLLLGTAGLAGVTLAMGSLAGCADDSEPSTWVKRLDDPATRPQAVSRLIQFFDDKMSTASGDRNAAEVKALLDEIVQPMADRCVAGDLDERTNAKLIKFLSDSRDARAEACYIKVLKEWKPEAKESETNVRWVARAVGAMKMKSAAAPLMDVFINLRVSKLKQEPELYRDVHDAMMSLADPAWESQLIDRLNRPIGADKKDVAALRDEVYWQTTAAEILGHLKSANAVKPLIKVAISPQKADVALNAIYALIKIGKPSVAPTIALLRGDDKELVEYSKTENMKAAAGPDGKAPDSAAKAAEKAYIGAAAIILAAIGREEATPALLDALDKLDKGDDLSRAIIARELVKLPKTPEILKAFQGVYEKTPTNLSIPPGNGGRESLLESSGYFFDASVVPWIVKDALDLKGEAEDVDSIRAASLTTCLKLMTPDQAGDVEKLFSIKAQGPDGKPTTLGKAYEKEYKITKDILAACGNKVDCYLSKAADPNAQGQETQFTGIKALYMLGVFGTPDVPKKILDIMPKLSNPALRFTAVQVMDRLSPKGDTGLATSLQKIVDDGEATKDPNKISGNAPFKMVIYRLNARAQ
jgi:HEAT repeat protein